MSSFRQVTTEISNKAALIQSLEELGYKPVDHENKVTVRGHGAETRKAEIILKKEDLKQGGDIGFALNKDGKYEIVTDTYVMRGFDINKFTTEVKKKYVPANNNMIARKNGWKLSRTITTDNGHTRYIYTEA